MGDARREKPVWESGPHAPWQATVKVVPIRLGDRVEFEVHAEWTGPPQPGFPPDPIPGHRSDSFQTPDLDLARGIAMRAVEQLREGAMSQAHAERGYVAMDLRGIHRRLAARLGREGKVAARGELAVDPMVRKPK